MERSLITGKKDIPVQRSQSDNPSAAIIVVAAIIHRDGRYLICQRRSGDAFGLKWEFPGGKVRDGEAPEAALRRELKEELGSIAAIGPLALKARHKYREMDREVELLFYLASLETAPLQNFSFEQIVWAEASRLPAYDFLDADRPLVEKLSRGELQLSPEEG